MGPPSRVLIAVTSATPAFYPGIWSGTCMSAAEAAMRYLGRSQACCGPLFGCAESCPSALNQPCAIVCSGGKKTGLYWSEALHPYNVFAENSFEVDVVSEDPSHFGYDEHSVSEEVLDPESKEAWHDSSNPLRRKLETTLLDASKVDASQVPAFTR
ncbi:hypothetical protein MMC07_008974 [Pseudocyphellaria aurata]|nr:hypothetical protein [Pseudocyphellaria aurata]